MQKDTFGQIQRQTVFHSPKWMHDSEAKAQSMKLMKRRKKQLCYTVYAKNKDYFQVQDE